ncbi:extracellular solute-binding protein [Paenibacillus sp. GYB004]|uniref:ABC transporter substrate-binding protein n=1 Tax=Paenibacillus sp. GYB004 TaxID=2994393 RepID=UPI002F968669
MRPKRFPDWEKELKHFPLNPKGVPPKLMNSVEERIAMEATPKRSRGKVWVAAAALLLASAVLFTQREPIMGLFKQKVETPQFDVKTERSIKVQWADGMSFMSRYGNAFIIQYPNMDVDAVSSPPYDPQKERAVQFEEFIEKEKPDVVYVPMEVYKKLADKGLLLPLDPFIQKEKYDLGVFQESVVETIREAGGGKLYGMAPNFSTQALYYNKSLFDKYGVPYPTDQMSWEDVLALAQRFPANGQGEDRVYGLIPYSASPYGTTESIGRTKGIGLTDADASKMTANTDAWRSIFQFVADGVKKGWLYESKPLTGSISGADFYKRNPFLTGNAAMMVSTNSTANDLIQAKQRYNLADFAWDIVTEPVDPAKPNVSSTFRIDEIYAIPANSENARDGWELIKSIHSEAMTRKVASSYTGNFGLYSRKFESRTPITYRLEAFTMLRPDGQPSSLAIMDRPLYTSLSTIVNEELKSAAAGTKNLDDAIGAIQQRGQTAIEQAKAEKKP